MEGTAAELVTSCCAIQEPALGQPCSKLLAALALVVVPSLDGNQRRIDAYDADPARASSTIR